MNNQEIRIMLEKEIHKHMGKISLYKRSEDKFKSHKIKRIKHMHKKHKTIHIAEKLGFIFCECCGGLRKR